jgi:hypothetical protein
MDWNDYHAETEEPPKIDYSEQIAACQKRIDALVSKKFKLQSQISSIDCKITQAYDDMFA